jgi:hypothetical protein
LSEFGDALGGQDRVNLEIHCWAVIEQVWRFTWMQSFSELRAALGGRDGASLEMLLEAMLK